MAADSSPNTPDAPPAAEGAVAKGPGLSAAASVLGVALLGFLFGVITAINQSPPYQTVRDAWYAYCSLVAQDGILAEEHPGHIWYLAEDDRGGVLTADPEHDHSGYTLFTYGNAGTASLIDGRGEVVHEWRAPFAKALPNSRHVPAWVNERLIVMRRAIAYPNGDLLALYETIANTPSGCGLAKLDVNGDVLWAYDDYAHHDVDVGPDGRVYVLIHELRRVSDKDGDLALLTDLPVVEDCVAILDAEGREQKRISLLDALMASPFWRPIITHVDRYGDVLHNNTVHVVGEGFASHHPEVSAGDLMVCLRNLNLVAVVNPDSEQIVWATNGPWEHPHDPDPLPNGNVLIFDNFAAHGAAHGSAVVEYDPRARRVAWQYTGEPGRHLRSDTRCCQQLLDDGNVLITECDRGRIVEVDRAGKTVWEFVHPLRAGEGNRLIPLVCGGRRYSADELPFLSDLPSKQPSGVPDGSVALTSN